MSKPVYTVELKDEAVQYYVNNDTTLEEVALLYGISSTTISRHLAELGYKDLKRHKTDRENAILKYLRTKNILTVEDLKKVL